MAEQPVIFSAPIENLIDKICKEQTQQPLDHLARQRLAAIEEQQALTLLTKISKCKIKKSLNAYVMYMLKQPPYSYSPSKPSPPSSYTLSPFKTSSLSASLFTPPPVARASNIHNTNAIEIQLPNVFPLPSPITTSPTKKEEKLSKIADFPQQVLNTTLPHISTLEGDASIDNLYDFVYNVLEAKQPISRTSPSVSNENLHDSLTLSSTHLYFPSFDNFVEELRHKVTHIRNLNKSAINPHIIVDQWKNCITFVNDWMNTNVECGQKIVEKNISSNSSAQIIEPITKLGIPKISTSFSDIMLPIIITTKEPTMNFTPPIQSQPMQLSATEEDLDNLAQTTQKRFEDLVI